MPLLNDLEFTPMNFTDILLIIFSILNWAFANILLLNIPLWSHHAFLTKFGLCLYFTAQQLSFTL